MWKKVEKKLASLYGSKETSILIKDLKVLFGDLKKEDKYLLSENDITLITYANSVVSKNEKSLKTFKKFADKLNLKKYINSVHFLPFYPWDTDRGFSVKDYYKVEETYGSWSDLKNISRDFKLMFDFVANHASIENPLVQGSLIERHLSKDHKDYKKYEPYKDFIIAFDEKDKPSSKDLKNLARPRPNPVLSEYFVVEENKNLRAFLGRADKSKLKGKVIGSGYVWTTFSRPANKDGTEATRQVDLNFRNPKVFLETIKILLFYVKNGASLIRLDAIGYIWKKPGSSSLHEKEAHKILEVIHDILEKAAPQCLTISEVNESQDKFYGYLGRKNHTESDLVYQFSHFPLAIYAVLTGNAGPYIKWFKTTAKFKGRQFTTVLGSHDGLGLKPVRDLLTEKELEKLTRILVKEHKSLPNYAILPGGKKIIYEICATPWNLINQKSSKENLETQINKFIAVLALGLCVRGIPGIYINGLLGVPDYSPKKGLDENRTVNREIFEYKTLVNKLNKKSQLEKTHSAVVNLLLKRKTRMEFNPLAPMPAIIDVKNHSVIAIQLTDVKKKNKLLSLVSVSSGTEKVNLPKKFRSNKNLKDIISNTSIGANTELELSPYQTLWLV